jgi:hypothetical protein
MKIRGSCHFPVPSLPRWSLEASNGRERPRKMMGEDGMVTYKINKKRGHHKMIGYPAFKSDRLKKKEKSGKR